jgi:hypothetical protein
MYHFQSYGQKTYAPLHHEELKRISNWRLFKFRMPGKGRKKEQAVSNNILHQKCLSEDGDGLQF